MSESISSTTKNTTKKTGKTATAATTTAKTPEKVGLLQPNLGKMSTAKLSQMKSEAVSMGGGKVTHGLESAPLGAGKSMTKSVRAKTMKQYPSKKRSKKSSKPPLKAPAGPSKRVQVVSTSPQEMIASPKVTADMKDALKDRTHGGTISEMSVVTRSLTRSVDGGDKIGQSLLFYNKHKREVKRLFCMFIVTGFILLTISSGFLIYYLLAEAEKLIPKQ